MYHSKIYKECNGGQSLIEILFAMSIATVAIATIAYLVLNTQVSARHSNENMYAGALAKEGIAAVRSISQYSFDDLEEGTHGLLFQNTKWVLSGSEDVSGKYTRSVLITEIDENMFDVTSSVVWNVALGRSSTSSYTTRVSNWRQTAGAASNLIFDTNGTQFLLEGTSVEGIVVSNTHTNNDLTLTHMSLEWDETPRLSSLTINSAVVYSASSSEEAVSQELLDTEDITIASGGVPISFGPIVFTSDMRHTNILVTMYLSDGSKRYMRIVP